MPTHLQLLRDFRNYFLELFNNAYATHEIRKIKELYRNHILFESVDFKNDDLNSEEYLQLMKNLNDILEDNTYEGYAKRTNIEKLYNELFGNNNQIKKLNQTR